MLPDVCAVRLYFPASQSVQASLDVCEDYYIAFDVACKSILSRDAVMHALDLRYYIFPRRSRCRHYLTSARVDIILPRVAVCAKMSTRIVAILSSAAKVANAITKPTSAQSA